MGGYVNQYNKELSDQKSRIDLEYSVIKTNELLIENQKGQKIIINITILAPIVGAVGTLGQWLLQLGKSQEKTNKQEQHNTRQRESKIQHHSKLEQEKNY
jgi:hypothetical protein